MAIKMIMFDLDGTLVDSSIDIRNAINFAISESGIAPISLEETRDLIGEGITKLFDKLKKAYNIPLSTEDLVLRFSEHYSEHLLDNTVLYPGVKEALKELDSCRKAVITNKREKSSVRILEAFGIAKYFDIIVGSDTTPERKPSPVPLQHALAKLSVGANESAIVGDSSFDIDAGLAAGVKTIAVTYGYRPAHELRKAHYLIDSFTDIPAVINSIP